MSSCVTLIIIAVITFIVIVPFIRDSRLKLDLLTLTYQTHVGIQPISCVAKSWQNFPARQLK
jgi:hypothetical protein